MIQPLSFVSPLRKDEIGAKREALERTLAGLGRTLVAYSGGVDSSFLLAEAHRVLGRGVAVGVIARSPSLPAREFEAALALAEDRGITTRVIETDEMDRAAYRANGPDRCFHCKTALFEALAGLAREGRWATVAYGAVTDDLGEVRPGMKAAEEYGVRAPLLEVRLSKLEVRSLAREAGIAVWDKPQAACLASRIPHGTAVTREKLRQVERSEVWLRRRFGLRVVRVRHHGRLARIETGSVDTVRLGESRCFLAIQRHFKGLGFDRVEIDPAGYRRPDPMPD